MLAKLCPKCKRIISQEQKYCDECQAKVNERLEERKKESYKAYDAKRDLKYVRFYHSKAWKNLERWKLKDSEYLCEDCKAEGKITVAEEVHHDPPIQTPEGWENRLNPKILKSLCKRHHNIRHKRFQGGRGYKKV